MTDVQTYGQDLPDQVDRIAELSDAQLELLADVRDLYRERAAIEREYANKLQLLGKKVVEKKSKKIGSLIVGNEPTKPWGDDVLRQSTVDHAYSQLLSALLNEAQAHVNLSDAFMTQVVEALKATERRHEDAKKKQIQYFQKLLSERERVYSERLKTKQKYDDECNEVEGYRQKQERSTDDRHADRAARQYEQQQVDMLNGKNVYLIATAVANKVKEKFYKEDLPALENQFQDLQGQLLNTFSQILLKAQALQHSHLDAINEQLNNTEGALRAIDPKKDQTIFIDHNIRAFSPPSDWGFEPCATHYDKGDMSVEPAPKVYVQNRLRSCRAKLQELQPVLEAKRKEVEQLAKLKDAYTADPKLGDAEEVMSNYLETQHQLVFYLTSERILTTEVQTVEAALGGDEGEQSPHTFKSSSFSIPTTCAYCKSSIWGLSKQGKTCKSCGISVHAKCELKVPADCLATRGGRGHAPPDTVSSISRSSTVSKSESPPTTPTPSSFTQSTRVSEESHRTARVVFDFTSSSPFELGVSEGALVQVLEEDDGSGWVKVADRSGGKGLVPASYIESVKAGSSVSQAAPARASARSQVRTQQGSGQFVRGLYEYQARGPDELGVHEGELIELTAGPSGGQNYADGWWEGVDSSGKKGIFPSNYVELV
ncbi:hypothetical protein OBBRIDRAFT_792810 [Obba rivulosa]|uniref:Protein BZZ1 n=1 Tax=Obba rivulosa TaxID=1052685 RepID=A0A8E2AZ65_9APHY|nr:hypothetical protein OBBRIDRAFT_792810 [Obba rivulosa]